MHVVMFIGIVFSKPNRSPGAAAAGDAFSDRSQVLSHEHALIVLWQKVCAKIFFSSTAVRHRTNRSPSATNKITCMLKLVSFIQD